jgi:cold shock CspA family protein
MARSQETFNKKEVRYKKEKKRKEKEKRRSERRENAREGKSFDDMIAYVDENGNITSTPQDHDSWQHVKAEDIEVSIPKRMTDKPEDTSRKGILVTFNDSKGFGFIKDLATQQSIFVHIHDILEPVTENSRVTFEIEAGHKGPRATHVKPDK